MGAKTATMGAVLHILMHACAKTLLFLTVGVVAYGAGTRSISKLAGMARSMPVAAAAFFVGAFALTGVPPLACFWSKMYMLAGALEVRGVFGPIALILALLESLISFAFFLWVGQKVFFGRSPDETARVIDSPRSMEWVLVAMIVVTLLAPLVGIPLVSSLAH